MRSTYKIITLQGKPFRSTTSRAFPGRNKVTQFSEYSHRRSFPNTKNLTPTQHSKLKTQNFFLGSVIEILIEGLLFKIRPEFECKVFYNSFKDALIEWTDWFVKGAFGYFNFPFYRFINIQE